MIFKVNTLFCQRGAYWREIEKGYGSKGRHLYRNWVITT
jgi:hypothetical protein